jgi:hypothetical protein
MIGSLARWGAHRGATAAPPCCPTTRLVARRWCAAPAAGAAAAADGTAKKSSGFLSEAKKEKILAGAIAATASSLSVIGVCHLIVCEVPLTIGVGSVAGAALTGALGVFEGEGSGGSGFGTAIGIFLGAVGAYFAKTSTEPWSSKKAK